MYMCTYLVYTFYEYIRKGYIVGSGKMPKLPIDLDWIATGKKDGETYKVTVSVEQTDDKKKFPPEGVKSVFRVFRLKSDGNKELVILIDNHEPFGFHEHDKLPEEHDSRKQICADDWKDAWKEFEERMKELFS